MTNKYYNKSTKSTLVIKRTNQWANRGRKINVFINNTKIGKIKDGETKIFTLEPGQVSLAVSIDWCKTTPIEFIFESAKTKQLELGCNLKGWLQIVLFFFVGFYWFIFNPKNYLYLKELETVED